MLHHKGTLVLETERLLLRRVRFDDAQDIHQNWSSDPEVARYCVWSPHRDLSETEQIAKLWADAYAEEDTYRWAITLKAQGDRIIGVIDVVEQDREAMMGEVGYALSRAYWRKGIVSEALSTVLPYLFSCGYERITACHDERNPNSGSVMRKCGMHFDALREGDVADNTGKPRNSAHYSITREEYEALQG